MYSQGLNLTVYPEWLIPSHFKIRVKHSKIRVKHSWKYCLEQINLLRTLLLLFRVSVPIIVLISGSFQTFLTALFSCPLLSTTVSMVLNLCTLLQYHLFKLFLPPSIFQVSESFPVSQFFASGDQSIGVSAVASVLPMKILDWFPLGLTGLIILESKGLSRVFSHTTVQKHHSTALSVLPSPTLTSIHDYWKNHSYD